MSYKLESEKPHAFIEVISHCERPEGLLAQNFSGTCVGKGASHVFPCMAVLCLIHPTCIQPVSHLCPTCTQPVSHLCTPLAGWSNSPHPTSGIPNPAPEWPPNQKSHQEGGSRKDKLDLNQNATQVYVLTLLSCGFFVT